jgi:hypothetical protein
MVNKNGALNGMKWILHGLLFIKLEAMYVTRNINERLCNHVAVEQQ